MNAVGNW